MDRYIHNFVSFCVDVVLALLSLFWGNFEAMFIVGDMNTTNVIAFLLSLDFCSVFIYFRDLGHFNVLSAKYPERHLDNQS